jgi:hypothetical protein
MNIPKGETLNELIEISSQNYSTAKDLIVKSLLTITLAIKAPLSLGKLLGKFPFINLLYPLIFSTRSYS